MIMSSKAITALNKLPLAERVAAMKSIIADLPEIERFSEASIREATRTIIRTYSYQGKRRTNPRVVFVREL